MALLLPHEHDGAAVRALVLSGGGAKGAYQVGVLRRLMLEQKRDYDILCGVSVGALNVAGLSMSPLGDPEGAYRRIAEVWSSINTSKVWRRRSWGDVLSAFFAESIYDAAPLADLVRRTLDRDAVVRSGRKVRVGAVSLDDGEYVSVDASDPRFAEWVLASSSFPVFLQPVTLGHPSGNRTKTWTDGGVRNVTPIGDAIRLGATEIDVVLCSNPDLPNVWRTKGRKAFEIALRVIDLMGDEVVRNDLEVAGVKNDLARLDGRYRLIDIRVIMPSRPLTSEPLNFDPAQIRSMMEIGYEDATKIRVTRANASTKL